MRAWNSLVASESRRLPVASNGRWFAPAGISCFGKVVGKKAVNGESSCWKLGRHGQAHGTSIEKLARSFHLPILRKSILDTALSEQSGQATKNQRLA